MPPSEEPMTDNNFTLSDATTPVRDEAETNISNMEAADIESELNNLLTIDEEYQNTVGSTMGTTKIHHGQHFHARSPTEPAVGVKESSGPSKTVGKQLSTKDLIIKALMPTLDFSCATPSYWC